MADIKSVVLTAKNAGFCFDQIGNFNLNRMVEPAPDASGVPCTAMLAEYNNEDNALKINQFANGNCQISTSNTITGLEIPVVTNVYDETGDSITNMIQATFKRVEGETGLDILDQLLTGNVELDLSVDNALLGICLESMPSVAVMV